MSERLDELRAKRLEHENTSVLMTGVGALSAAIGLGGLLIAARSGHEVRGTGETIAIVFEMVGLSSGVNGLIRGIVHSQRAETYRAEELSLETALASQNPVSASPEQIA